MSKPRIYLDSCCFIDAVKYSIGTLESDRQQDAWFVKQILQAHKAGDVIACTSLIAVGECLAVGKDQTVAEDVKNNFRSLLTSGQYVMLAHPTPKTAKYMQDFRWLHGLQLGSADALHLSAALEVGCVEFLTSDDRLKKVKFNKAFPVLRAKGLSITSAQHTVHLPQSYRQAGLTATATPTGTS